MKINNYSVPHINIIFSPLFSFISSYSKTPSILLANKASEATAEEVAEKQAQLEEASNELDSLRKEREDINNQHSREGDTDDPNEADTGELLEATDNSIQVVLEIIAELVNWLGS